MKLNIAYPMGGGQKQFEIEDEKKYRIFFEKRIAQEVEMGGLGDEWKGYVGRITGGNDKQGFPMMQGILTNGRVRLLLRKGSACFRPRRSGEQKRKSVHGCIVDGSLSALNLVIVKKGDEDIPGLTDPAADRPKLRGPKRASKIRKMFNLDKKDDVRQYVVRKPLPEKTNSAGRVMKARSKAPKIQRLITPVVLQRKRRRIAAKRKRAQKKRESAREYSQLLATRLREAKERKAERRRSSSMSRSRDSQSQR